MSAIVKLGSKLPGDFETNGLDGIVKDLVLDGKTPRIALVVFDVAKVEHDLDSGEDVPTVRVRRFEPAGLEGEVFAQLQKVFLNLNEQRTGKSPLPYDQVEIVHEQGHLDGETGDDA